MSDVKVTLSSALARFAAEERSFVVRSGTVAEVIDQISARHPALRQYLLDESGIVLPFISIYIGEDNIRDLPSRDVAVPETATVLITSAVAGG